MKKILLASLLGFAAFVSQAKEVIVIASAYPPGHSGHGALMKVFDNANNAQDKYTFILETHPGAQGLVALNYVKSSPANRLALVQAGIVDVFETNKAKETDFVPTYAFGDACWAVAVNWPMDETKGIKSIKAPPGANEFVIGAIGIGSISHMSGLEIAHATGHKPLTVVFKSGNEALVNLAANNGVNITVDSVQNVLNMKSKSDSIKISATTCNERNPLAPHVPTLIEQGLGHIPPVINIALSSAEMPVDKRKDIEKTLDQATLAVGAKSIFDISSFKPAVFQNLTAQQFYDRRVGQIKTLRKKYAKELLEANK